MTDHPAAGPRPHLPPAAEFLYWPPQSQAYGYRIVDRLFHSRTVPAGGAGSAMPYGPELDLRYVSGGIERGIDAFMDHNVVAGLLVLKAGRIVLERYGLGLRDHDRWSTMSTVKSITAMLVGACIRDGVIECLDDPVERYLPAIGGSGYEGVTLRHLLTMSSGLAWSEAYADPASDVNRYSRCLAEGTPDGVITLLRGLRRTCPPGTRWAYNTGDTYLLGRVLVAALGGPLADYLSQTIWKPAGMEFDAFYTLDMPGGNEIGGSRAGMALRDFGRVGQVVLDDGVIGGRRVLPEGWVDEALSPVFLFGPRDQDFGSIRSSRLKGYGYSWWIGEDGSAQAHGFAGQRIFLDRAERLAIVTLSAFPQLPHVPAPVPDRHGELRLFTDAVRDALRG
ncbi:serine hydrolase domain-containing protein [Thalassobaculum salexigens]|uniref:serine hydrolase domain-containing protein n=1 Tax=Thalassobaculum salexigens TaxID=455360 RepID=UPI0003F71B61|nr:serine hydrolase domain-containing protein [Thalassobaculum salexigens]